MFIELSKSTAACAALTPLAITLAGNEWHEIVSVSTLLSTLAGYVNVLAHVHITGAHGGLASPRPVEVATLRAAVQVHGWWVRGQPFRHSMPSAAVAVAV